MSRRRVEVELVLEAGNYLAESQEITASTKSSERAVHELGSEADSTSRDMKELAANTDVAAHEVDKLGDQSRQTAAEMEVLDRKIAQTKRSVAQLGLEFAATGNAATGRRFSSQKSLLTKLERLKTDLGNFDGQDIEGGMTGLLGNIGREAEKAGKQAGKGFWSGIADFGGAGVKPFHALIAGLVAAVIAALPTIGAMVAGAVAGLVGVGGIVGGVLMAVKDPVVKSAFGQFGDDIKRIFFGGGAAFIEPIRGGLAILDKAFADMNLGDAFAKVAPFVTTLAAGIAELVHKMMPGLNKALERAGPFITAMAIGLGQVGNALGGFFDRITASHGAIEGLRFLFSVLSGTIAALGATLRWLSDAFHWTNKRVEDLSNGLGKLFDFFGAHGVADDFQRFAGRMESFTEDTVSITIPAIDKLGDSWAGNADKIRDYNQAIVDANTATGDFLGTALNLDQANTAVGKGFLDLTAAIKENGKHWNDNTQAAYANQTAVEQQLGLLEQQRQAYINAHGSTVQAIAEADKKYNEQLQLILAIAAAAGATTDQLKQMANTYTIKIDVIEIHKAVMASVLANKTDRDLAVSGRAAGGSVLANVPYRINEQQSEVVTFPANGMVQPASLAAQQWSGGSAAAGPLNITLNAQFIDPMTGAVQRTAAIRYAVDRGVPQAAIAAAYP